MLAVFKSPPVKGIDTDPVLRVNQLRLRIRPPANRAAKGRLIFTLDG